MAKGSYLQTSFLGGAWSLTSQGRLDLPMRKNAMAVCQNSVPIEEGVVVRRPGTQRVGATAYSAIGVMRSIDMTGSTPLSMEMTAGHLRFWFGTARCRASGYAIESISTAKPAVLTIGDYPGGGSFSTGKPIVLLPQGAVSVQTLAYLHNKVFTLTKLTTTTFALTDEATGEPLDGSLVGWNNGLVCEAASIVDLTIPYLTDDIPFVRLVQNEYQVMLLHNNYAPLMVTIVPALGGLVPGQFTPSNVNMSYSISPVVFIDGPYLNPSGAREATVFGTAGLLIAEFSNIASINNGLGFSSTDVGRLIRFFSEPPYWDPNVEYQTGQAVTYNNTYYVFTGLQANTSEAGLPVIDATGLLTSTPDSLPISWTPSSTVQTWTWAVIMQVFNTLKISVQIEGPQTIWGIIPMTFALGVYSNTTGWPACGCYHEGRFWLAGAQPNRFDASVANNVFAASLVGASYFSTPVTGGNADIQEFAGINTYVQQLSFAPTDSGGAAIDNLPGVVLDSSAISETLNSAEINQIVWMQPNAQGILVGTPGGEYLIQASNQNNVLTPTSIQVHQVTKYCCANAEARRAGLTTLFIQKHKRKLFELLADVFSGKFVGPNLSEQTKLLTLPGIQEIAYQEEKTPICWMLMGDATLVGTTYRRISMFSTEPAKFNAWHTHTLGTGYLINSITVGPAPNGETDALIMATSSPDRTVNSVELMFNLDEQDPLPDAWFLDFASKPVAGATSNSGFPSGGVTLLGLDYLQGMTVTVFLCGFNCGSYLVPANGQVFVPYGSDPDKLFTYNYGVAMSQDLSTNPRNHMPVDYGALTFPCTVGIPYVSQGQLLRPLEPLPGSNGPSLGKTRRTHMFGALLANAVSGAISFGTDLLNTLAPALFRSPGGTPYVGNQTFNDVYWSTLNADYNFDNGIAWQITGPYPGTVCAIEGFLEAADR